MNAATTADRPTVGFLGAAGMMGHGMAKNLLAKGFGVRLMAHRKRDSLQDLLQEVPLGGTRRPPLQRRRTGDAAAIARYWAIEACTEA